MTSPAIDVADFRTRETEQLEKRVEQLLNEKHQALARVAELTAELDRVGTDARILAGIVNVLLEQIEPVE